MRRSTTTEDPITVSGRRLSNRQVTVAQYADGTREASVVDDNQRVLASMHITSSGRRMTMDAYFVPPAMSLSRFCRDVAEMYMKALENGGSYADSSDCE